MELKFSNIHRTTEVLEAYAYTLPSHTQSLYDTLPNRWNTLKGKVLLAKQRLGPRIQEESSRITRVIMII